MTCTVRGSQARMRDLQRCSRYFVPLLPALSPFAEDLMPRSRSRVSSLVKHYRTHRLQHVFRQTARLWIAADDHQSQYLHCCSLRKGPRAHPFLLYRSEQLRAPPWPLLSIIIGFPMRCLTRPLRPHFPVRGCPTLRVPTCAPVKCTAAHCRPLRYNAHAARPHFHRICLAIIKHQVPLPA